MRIRQESLGFLSPIIHPSRVPPLKFLLGYVSDAAVKNDFGDNGNPQNQPMRGKNTFF
jgi:hypothetical protein